MSQYDISDNEISLKKLAFNDVIYRKYSLIISCDLHLWLSNLRFCLKFLHSKDRLKSKDTGSGNCLFFHTGFENSILSLIGISSMFSIFNFKQLQLVVKW